MTVLMVMCCWHSLVPAGVCSAAHEAVPSMGTLPSQAEAAAGSNLCQGSVPPDLSPSAAWVLL